MDNNVYSFCKGILITLPGTIIVIFDVRGPMACMSPIPVSPSRIHDTKYMLLLLIEYNPW
jgi:hypothetical protein